MAEQPLFRIAVAGPEDREAIYRMRHIVYAEELGQHPTNAAGALQDALDDFNEYLVAYRGTTLAGFISITPPGRTYSLDKYLPRAEWPFPADDTLYEVRILTVAHPFRHSDLAPRLMYEALHYLIERKAQNIIAIGRREVLPIYRRVGLEPFGHTFTSGSVTYELMGGSVDHIRQRSQDFARLLARWGCADQPAPTTLRGNACYHGGAFFEAIGPDFTDLTKRHQIINADVLDAWFPPAPGAIAALQEHLPWLLQTSPPTQCEGVRTAIATARGVSESTLVLGAGSSDLIFRAFQNWLTHNSRVLLLDPTYGEYAHVLTQVIGCTILHLPVSRETGYTPDLVRLVELGSTCDLVVIVNPNNPTGTLIPRTDLITALTELPTTTRVWVDEAYIDYTGPDNSLEHFALTSENVVVCKSLSKVLALSGARAAYLVAPELIASDLRRLTPPWVISLPAQVAAVHALHDPAYYAARYAETHQLRDILREMLQHALPTIPLTVPNTNWLLCHLPTDGPTAAEVVAHCRAYNVFLRDTASMGSTLGQHTLRIAVKDAATNRRIVEVLATCNVPASGLS